ncbi:MAG TPA: EAL domain-containing protein [Noviherbaspirillum sp.]|uniref:bifunctional diguanylate cyclase/phosphodiesterase n=1 Tax=Noviherbaspirillum sp. TaxID=1926288 RepID=UPI002DDDA894|nr:EAL domain-containing protein [Noviherbaspirillum sp.]HEV2609152.1 EAL domain-containing protein [Noviherbaspirillum sp.]
MSLAHAYSDELFRTIRQIDQITLNLKYYWQKTGGKLELEDQRNFGLYPASSMLQVVIVDRNGMPLTSTHGMANEDPALSGKDFFRRHKNDPSPQLLINPPSPELDIDRMRVRFSRRLDTADGEFDGIVIVSATPDYLASFHDESLLNGGDLHGVTDANGTVLAFKGDVKINSNGRGLNHILPMVENEPQVLSLAGMHFSDQRSRMVVRQAVPQYPVTAVIALSDEEMFQSYHQARDSYRNIAVIGSICLIAFTLTGMIFSLRLAWRNQQADEVRRAYRMATDEAREGFYMVRAIYDRDRKIVDFLLEDCNERGASIAGLTRAGMIGMRFWQLFSGEHAKETFEFFVEVMRTGFYEGEYLVSPNSPVHGTWMHRKLVRSGDTLAITLRDVSDTKAHEQALAKLANTDVLTNLPNRHWLTEFLPGALERAKHSGKKAALLFVDLDDFKNINDTLGHASGDELLQAAALRLRSVIRPGDNVARLGGDEFTVIIEQVESNDDVCRVAERIVKTLSEPFHLADGNGHIVHGSIGISLYPEDGDDARTLLKHADIAMYAAKANGKGHYQFFQPQLSESLVVRLNREHALRGAIERDEFVLFYQPRVDTFSGELRSMEALVRWMHPERGLVPPLDFIPMAEDTGLIVKLGELVIRKACAQLAQWKAAGLALVPVSINVSPRQFNQGNISALFASSMAEHGIDATLVEIEITESCMMGDGHVVTEQLAAIDRLGIRLLVDDFGTGYSSLSQLQQLDLDTLKIDKAFTAQVCNGKEGEAFFMAILSMAHVLGMSVVAEGVETEEQLQVLQALSCNEVQGYYVSKPVPAAEMPALMEKRFLFPATRNLLKAG